MPNIGRRGNNDRQVCIVCSRYARCFHGALGEPCLVWPTPACDWWCGLWAIAFVKEDFWVLRKAYHFEEYCKIDTASLKWSFLIKNVENNSYSLLRAAQLPQSVIDYHKFCLAHFNFRALKLAGLPRLEDGTRSQLRTQVCTGALALLT